ncbi:MAG: DNA-binding protein [Desulfovibrionaceae bacterium]|nr:DNA-binding protein [Desulfovibrionaceae bacterium]
MSMIPQFKADEGEWMCGRCNVPLEQLKATATYLNSAFDVILPRCPRCGFTLVPKSLAQGKMQEVEALLENK